MPLGSFHCEKLKKALKRIQSYEDVPIFTQNGLFAPNETFFGEIICIINAHYNFGSKMTHLLQPGIFLEKLLI